MNYVIGPLSHDMRDVSVLCARIKELELVIEPLVNIANEYDKDGLDEARPYWVTHGTTDFRLDQELYAGRGGKTLLTLGEVLRARTVLTGKPYNPPGADETVVRAREMYNATQVKGPGWDSLSEEEQQTIIERVKAFRV
jgi:hypothetical protein